MSRTMDCIALAAVLALVAGCKNDEPGGGDGSEPSTKSDGGTNAGTDTECVLEAVEPVDWMAPGPHAAGVQMYSDTVDYAGETLTRNLQITYPATVEGPDAPVANGPFPVVVFEHAWGSDYLNYDWLFARLASRGYFIVSADHNGAWDSTGEWWEAHATLFAETIDLVFEWDGDPASPYYDRLDTDRLALMGHSHGGGGALRVMGDYAPMNPASPVAISGIVLITTRPDLDSYYDGYHDAYDGMAPLLNVGASYDEDGTTAYGASIAVYEPITRPRFMTYVQGASHNTFTDEAQDTVAIIDRELGQVAGGAAIISFLAYVLEDDERVLPGWRGDVALFEDGPEVRTQLHEAGAVTIDDFEAETAEIGAAIAGIEGQTFVNGFLGDTFVDFEAGVALIQTEVETLLPAGGDVLFYQDATRWTDAYGEALSRMDSAGQIALTTTAVDTELADLLTGSWDLVVATQQDGGTSDTRPFDAPLADWICNGGKAILSDFRLSSSTAQATFACAGAHFDGASNWTTMTSTGSLFDGELTVQNSAWGIFSVGLTTDETVYATDGVEGLVLHDPTVNALGFAVTATDLATFDVVWTVDSGRALYMPTWALELAWEAPGASVRWDLAAEDDSFDATLWQVLSLRLLALHDDPLNPTDEGLDLHVRITDASGTSATLPLSAAPGGALLPTPPYLKSTTPKSVFETRRLPLRDFQDATPTLSLSRLSHVELVLDLSATGRILVDDLELAPGRRCE